jgi:hypothetical protein
MARDSRDAAISRMFYRWHRGNFGHWKQYEEHLNRGLQKEQDPESVTFYEIYRYTVYDGWPWDKEAVFK